MRWDEAFTCRVIGTAGALGFIVEAEEADCPHQCHAVQIHRRDVQQRSYHKRLFGTAMADLEGEASHKREIDAGRRLADAHAKARGLRSTEAATHYRSIIPLLRGTQAGSRATRVAQALRK